MFCTNCSQEGHLSGKCPNGFIAPKLDARDREILDLKAQVKLLKSGCLECERRRIQTRERVQRHREKA